jgi:hypothetical protein
LNIFEQIKANRAETYRKIEELRADKTLSAEGKRVKISQAYREGIEKHKQLISHYKAEVESRKNEVVSNLYRHPLELFGHTDVRSKGFVTELRELIEKAEAAYKSGEKEVNALTERAINMRDKAMIRALSAVAYANGDYKHLEALADHDAAAKSALEFEQGLGEFRDAQTKLQLQSALSGIEAPPEVSSADKNLWL